MSLKMSDFHGIDQSHLSTLKTAGIENTDDLMKLWSDKTKRAGLISSTGIAEEQFMKFAAMARLGRVKGMELKHISALVAAGIDGPKRLFSYTPETLVNHLGKVAAEKKLTDPMPTFEEITAWFATPRPESNGQPHTRPESVVAEK
jgi:uncharacterized protein DUF4332